MELHCMLYAVWSYKRVIFFILKFDIVSILFRAFNFMDIVFASSYYHFEKQIITLVPIFYGNSREKVLWKLLLLLFPYMNIKHSLSLSFFLFDLEIHHSIIRKLEPPTSQIHSPAGTLCNIAPHSTLAPI